MTRIALVAVLVSALSACVAHKITATEDFRQLSAESLSATGSQPNPNVFKINEGPEGWQCFEPMMYVLSLGIIPAHCLDRYHVSWTDPEPDSKADLKTHFELSSVQGWVTLVLVLSPHWKFGYSADPEEDIQRMVRRRSRQTRDTSDATGEMPHTERQRWTSSR